ncbi:MAG TPA: lysophospholipid acyltransferase family protein [Tepidisphaeraceae bacterium]|nr:lysophospholipid acyltransferase family protein [Tepidisphaeraceae bacterium]
MTDSAHDDNQALPVPQRTMLWKSCAVLCRIATSLALDLKVRGERNIPERGGVLLVTNHQSNLDPVIIGVRMRRPLAYLAKSELFVNPIFGALIRSLHAFPVKQGTGDIGAVKESIRLLKAGHVLNIFPEGSRSPDGQLQPILPGAALVVKRAGVPVVPVVLDGTFEAWPRGKKLPRPHPVWVEYGRPMEIAQLESRAIVEIIGRQFQEMFARVKAWRASDGY